MNYKLLQEVKNVFIPCETAASRIRNILQLPFLPLHPRLPEAFLGFNLPKRDEINTPQINAEKPTILIILVREDRYESFLSIDTNKVLVALHLTKFGFFEFSPKMEQIYAKTPRNMQF